VLKISERKFTSYPVHNFAETKIQMLNWAKQFSIFCFLDNHKYNFSEPSFECLLAAGTVKTIEMPAGAALYSLQQFKQENNDWLFGHFAYDLKNEIENLSSVNIDNARFPDIFFFIPQILLLLGNDELKIGVLNIDPDKVFSEIFSTEKEIEPDEKKIPEIKSRYTKEIAS